jgi:hypothetical protein
MTEEQAEALDKMHLRGERERGDIELVTKFNRFHAQ